MPVKIPDALPARKKLEEENIFVMTEKRAAMQDIRPLHIAILNLMPEKEATETQLLRLISNSPLQVDITLMQTASRKSSHTSPEHLASFYKTFDQVEKEKFDGIVITGAPVESLGFEEVSYWPELVEILSWSKENVFSTLHICWAAQAGLFYHYGIEKYPVSDKVFGVFPHKIRVKNHKLLIGFDDVFYAPHSRHTEIRREDILKNNKLQLLAESDEAGVLLVTSKDGREIYITGHLEYDVETLGKEYRRDLGKGLPIKLPKHYFPNDDQNKKPLVNWRCHGNLLFNNWLNYFVYQETPYELDLIRSK